MAQSLAKILVHIIFSTEDRFAFLVDADIRRRLHTLRGTERHTWAIPKHCFSI